MEHRKTLVSFESVAAAAESLDCEGQRPTVRAVIALLGGGSPNTVVTHLNAWKAARPAVKASDVTLDPRIVSILAEQITSAVMDATRAANLRAADMEADAQAVAEAGRIAELRADELADELTSLQNENQQQAGKLDALTSEIEQVKKETSSAVAEARTDANREREAAEAARQALARAELRLESLPGLEDALTQLRVKLDEERMGRTLAEKMQAVSHSELVHVQSENQQHVSRADAMVRELDEMKRELAGAISAARDADKTAAVATAKQQAAERRAEDLAAELQLVRQPKNTDKPKSSGGEAETPKANKSKAGG